jgi:diguanylate cyclase (GGDEF)-like protein
LLCERICKCIEDYQFKFNNEQVDVTLSIGICARQPEMKSFKEMIRIADKVLYEDKSKGRNQVAIA